MTYLWVFCFVIVALRIEVVSNVDKLTHGNVIAQMDIVMVETMWAKDPGLLNSFPEGSRPTL